MPLLHEHALPTDEDVDAFRSGNPEVDNFFHARKWINKNGEVSPATYKLRAAENNELVGYASAAFRNVAHPDNSSTKKAKYLVIYAAGVCSHLQGVKPEGSDETFATLSFRFLEGLALGDSKCVGLSLLVREDNARARRFYVRFGFEADPGGPVKMDSGVPLLPMRKQLPPVTL